MPGWRNCQNAMITNAANTNAAEPAARPSRPSVRFTAFDDAVDHERPRPRTTAAVPRSRSSDRVNDRCVETFDVVEREQREPDGDEELAARSCPACAARGCGRVRTPR